MKFAKCRPYHSKTVGRELLRMPDGKSMFKVYFLSLVGRDEPEKYEWARCPMKTADFMSLAGRQPLEGVGFITAFTHITKVFRFAPAIETVLHVRAFNTKDFSPLDLGRDDKHLEFACYAEAEIAAEEYHAWAAERSVEAYLARWSRFDDGPVVSRTKLAEYFGAAQG